MIARQLSRACRQEISHRALRVPSEALAILHCGALHFCLPALDLRPRCKTTAAAQESFKRPSSKRPPRFFVPPPNLLNENSVGATFQLNINETHHALRVLRLREGDALEVCDGMGSIAEGRFAGLTHNNRAFVETTGDIRQVLWQGPKWEVAVACFSLKKDRADWLVEKCTELGAWGLRPILTVRSPHLGRKQLVIEVAPLDAESEEELEDVETPEHARQLRWQRVVQAAVKQSLRAHAMTISKPLLVGQLAAQVARAPLALVGVEGAPPISQVLAAEQDALRAASLPEADPSMLLVGPEGDFTPGELDGLIEAGARPVGLGPNRLRVETAALSMLTAVTLWDRG